MSKKGVLLINLGSPDSTSVPDVRKYLGEFLMDGRVLDAPYPIRWCIVHLGILPRRPAESAEAYKKVQTPEGMPLVAMSRHVHRLLRERVGEALPVELSMRYQNPSIEAGIKGLQAAGVTDVLVVPLFPHYAMSSFESAAERAREVAGKIAPGMKLKIIDPYYDDPGYIDALVASARGHLDDGFDYLLFSFHGIPERHLRKSDPTKGHCLATPDCCERPSPAHKTCYRAQCFATVRAFVAKAGIPAAKYSVSFQSRLGGDPWLKPYTDFEFKRLAEAGVKKLLVMCPAFVSDCLETLEEIAMRGQEEFTAAGGGSLSLVPCLNEHPKWIEALEAMIRRNLPA